MKEKEQKKVIKPSEDDQEKVIKPSEPEQTEEEKEEKKKQSELVNYQSPRQLQEFSKELKKFIVQNKLFSNIKGKNYVNVEGWEFAGASMGIFSIIKEVRDLSNEKEIKYRVEVELKPLNSEQPIGYGVAICSNKEESKKTADEYVIISMAQTRAIGKAYRNTFAYLMKMAGYEATPTEEMMEFLNKQKFSSKRIEVKNGNLAGMIKGGK